MSLKPGVDPFDASATIESLFGDLKGRVLQEAIWSTYQARSKQIQHVSVVWPGLASFDENL